MKFAVIADYDAADPQLPVVRPVHREYLTKLRDAGKLAPLDRSPITVAR